MAIEASRFQSLMRSWGRLGSLHALPIDLGRVDAIRTATLDELADPEWVSSLVVRLGINDEERDEFPRELQPHLGQGLRIWQYPHQFSKYLTTLARLDVRSYLEVGIRHGGSFIATVEYLNRFRPLDAAIGVDVIPCPAMDLYCQTNPAARFWCINSRGPEMLRRLKALGTVDLVFIDSHHEEEQCHAEWELFRDRANMVAFHDIENVGCPGVKKIWRQVTESASHRCVEFVEQYAGLQSADPRRPVGPFMGIGLAVRRDRPRLAEVLP